MDRENSDVDSWGRTKDCNDNDTSIHASGDKIEDNANKKEQGLVIQEHKTMIPLSSYSSKVRSDDEEYCSDDDEQSKGRHQDLLDSAQEEMSLPTESKFVEVCEETWEKAKPKGSPGRRGKFKNILISNNSSYSKTQYLNSEIYNKVHDATTNRAKGAQRRQRAYVKATIPLIQAVVNLKEIEKKAKKRVFKENFSKNT